MSNLWSEALDDTNKIEYENKDALTLDQQIQLAQLKALLAIGQELSNIHHSGINNYVSD